MTDVVLSSAVHDVLLFADDDQVLERIDAPVREVVTLFAGEPGPRGLQGVQGPAGRDGVDGLGRYQSFSFPTPAATWIVEHNCGRVPSVSVLDDTGAVMLADVEHGSLNQLSVTHSRPTSGSVHLHG